MFSVCVFSVCLYPTSVAHGINYEWILTFKVSKQPYRSSQHDRIFESSANASLLAKYATEKIIAWGLLMDQ